MTTDRRRVGSRINFRSVPASLLTVRDIILEFADYPYHPRDKETINKALRMISDFCDRSHCRRRTLASQSNERAT